MFASSVVCWWRSLVVPSHPPTHPRRYQFQASSKHQNATIADGSLLEQFSATKIITSIAAAICVDRGLFKLNDPLSKFIPEFAGAKVYASGGPEDMVTRPAVTQPTLRHALTHTSGVTGYAFEVMKGLPMHPVDLVKAAAGTMPTAAFGAGATSFVERFPTLEAWIAADASIPLAYEPGTQWVYSFAHSHVARAIEVASGKTFGAFVQQEIFDPLGMAESSFTVDCALPTKLPVFAPDMTRCAQGVLPAYTAEGHPINPEIVGCVPRDASPFASFNIHCATTAYHDHGVAYFGDAQLVSSVRDWISVAKLLSPEGGGRGTFNGKRVLSPGAAEMLWQDHLSAQAVGAAVRATAPDRAGVELPLGWSFGLGGQERPSFLLVHHINTVGFSVATGDQFHAENNKGSAIILEEHHYQ